METYDSKTIALDQLLLDPNNYRFKGEKNRPVVSDKRFGEATVQKKTAERLRQDGLQELKQSILANGFLPVERIVVRAHEYSPDGAEQYVVLEGNRRVASLKWIQEEADTGADVPEDIIDGFQSVPTILLTSDDPSAYLAIMGIRHVGGIS